MPRLLGQNLGLSCYNNDVLILLLDHLNIIYVRIERVTREEWFKAES